MPVSLKPSHLKRYKDIAVLLMKYGRGDLAKRLDVDAEMSFVPGLKGWCVLGLEEDAADASCSFHVCLR